MKKLSTFVVTLAMTAIMAAFLVVFSLGKALESMGEAFDIFDED